MQKKRWSKSEPLWIGKLQCVLSDLWSNMCLVSDHRHCCSVSVEPIQKSNTAGLVNRVKTLEYIDINMNPLIYSSFYIQLVPLQLLQNVGFWDVDYLWNIDRHSYWCRLVPLLLQSHLGGTHSLSLYSGSMLIPSSFTFKCCRYKRKKGKRLKEDMPRTRGI